MALGMAVMVAGPTASGKSALASMLAGRLGGVVVNADSMQIYRDLRVVTARPGPADEARVPHVLYGVRAAAEPANAAWWCNEALRAMDAAQAAGRVPILCGGTGLYLSALVRGIAPIPEPGEAARTEARGLLAELGAGELHRRLSRADPATAAGLRPSDGQRVARAWEVWRGTGRGLAAWQAVPSVRPPWRFRAVVLDPPRDGLRRVIAGRFRAMLEQGAVEEVRALLAQRLQPDLPLMRAVGVPQLARAIRGEATLDEATGAAILATGQYAKRQATWFRNRGIADPCDTHRISAETQGDTQFYESLWREIEHFITGHA